MKISLCMIVGNCSEYIERCLSSFKGVADELVVVRAIGCQEPDRTLEIANGFGAVIGEYHNQRSTRNWPHVDDFAAARQLSFDLATGEFCMWVDSDDVLERGGELVREIVDKHGGDYSVFILPYRIFGRGVTVPRERIIRRGAGKWRYPVHECFVFDGPVDGVQDDRIVITHLPHGTKSGSNERNLRILETIPPHEMNGGLWYHLHGEYICAKKIPKAIEAAKKALGDDKLGVPEKYEIYLNLARCTEAPQAKMAFLGQAYLTDPRRREALGLLACAAMDYGMHSMALAYARQMMATPAPEQSWNDREAAYSWLGVDIFCQALRVNGFGEEAEKMRRGQLAQAGGPRISLIHATRGRAWQASFARKLWLDLADDPASIEHIFVVDDDDAASAPLKRMHHLVVPAGGGCVQAWNHGVFATSAPVIIQMSDDWVPPAKWDRLVIEALGDLNEPRVLAVSDGARKDDLLCMAICTRNYWAQDFFLFHPWFRGVWSDNYFTRVAYERGQVIEAKEIVFEHKHPIFGKAEMDETYRAQNSQERYAEGHRVYEELCQKEDWSTVPGWFNFWPFYQMIAKRLPDNAKVAEVGVWKGRSLIFLAQECKRLGKDVSFVAVDTFAGDPQQPEHAEAHERNLLPQFKENLKRCGVEDRVIIFPMRSLEAARELADEEFDFVFIDAAHDYANVKKDIKAWLPKVKEGGILAGHDFQHEDVRRAVRELLPGAKDMMPCWMVEVR